MAKAARGTRRSAPRRSAPARARAKAATEPVALALAAFAHEVRTPLTGLLAAADLLDTAELGERERRWIATIKAAGEHLSALTTLFVDGARGSRLRLRNEAFDLAALVNSLADSLHARAIDRGLEPRLSVARRLPGWVRGDAVRLRAAIENLIDNAVKFTEGGRVALTVTATPLGEGRVAVRFAVADSGIGLTEAEARRLFRPFSQANARIAARFGGAGLGLASARQIARAMGGDITVERNRRGSTFTATVALRRAAPPAAPPDYDAAPMRILSAEDNPFGRVVLKAVLDAFGHQVEFVGRGEEALARLRAEPFDAVLMDMVLPGLSGVATIRRIRALKGAAGRVPIIGLSGKDGDEPRARRAGADAFLLKPAAPRALAAALDAARRPRAGASS